jgi:phosphonate transport system substrate-binding protein
MESKNPVTTLVFSVLFTVLIVIFIMKAQQNTNVSTKKTYSVGYMKDIFSEVDINDAQAAIRVLINEILKSSNYSHSYYLKAKIYANLSDVVEQMKQDSLAMLSLNTYDYLNYFEKIELNPVLVPVSKEDVFVQYYILVRKGSNFNKIADLKGANIGLLSGVNYIASKIWLDVILAKVNFPDKTRFFKNITMSDKESQLIVNLFFGRVDACIVSSEAFSLMKDLNPQIGEKIVCIQSSPKYLWGVMCFTSMIKSQEDKNLFYKNSIQIQKSNSGEQLYSLLKITGLEPFKTEYLNSFKDLLKEYTYLLKAKKIINTKPD